MKEKMLIGGQWTDGSEYFPLINPYNDEVVTEVPLASEEEVEKAVTSALRGFKEISALPSHKRADILLNVSYALIENKENITHTIVKESGKPLKYATGEVGRAAETFRFASEETKRIHGETIPMGASKGSENRMAFYERFPMGIIGAITPFNFPINLVAHKVAPAIAAGNAIVLKPAEQTPLTALKLGKILIHAGLPPEAINIVTGDGTTGAALVRDERLQMITFTGSPPVGREIKARAGMKKVTLELGSNSGVIIEPDADIDAAVDRSVMGAFANSGQVCISLQRIYLHREIYNSFRDRFVEKVRALKCGDPMSPETDIGPLIDKDAVKKTGEWLKEAVREGARILCGGKGENGFFEPTVLDNTSRDMKVICGEVFAPVVSLIPYDSFDEALGEVNDSIYGLQAGVYTNDINKAFNAFKTLDVGGVIINDVPTYRADHMPYGGVKESGTGREGLRYAIEEMTELKTMIFNL
ncbi:MAG: aldehyde dehydrogenase family protein [Proteobacteria bacterium]|nr:aldehyde dehydrogenase family protein [Pseudomonadota bacterium]